jgi:hypothetical protein
MNLVIPNCTLVLYDMICPNPQTAALLIGSADSKLVGRRIYVVLPPNTDGSDTVLFEYPNVMLQHLP